MHHIKILFLILLPCAAQAQVENVYKQARDNPNLSPMWKVCAELKEAWPKFVSDTALFDMAQKIWDQMSTNKSIHQPYPYNERFYKIKNDLFTYCPEFKRMGLKNYHIPEDLYDFQKELESGHVSISRIPDRSDQVSIQKTIRLLNDISQDVFFDLSDLTTNTVTTVINYYLFTPMEERKPDTLKSKNYLVFQISYDFAKGLVSNFRLNTETELYQKYILFKTQPPLPPGPPPPLGDIRD